mgnify:CR=1 FL=1
MFSLTSLAAELLTLEWSELEGASHYQVVVYNLSNKELVTNLIVENTTSYTLQKALNPDNVYYWTVRAQNPSGAYNPWTKIIHSFSLGTPELTFPEGIVDIVDPVFQWKVVQNAQTYHIIIQNINTQELIVNQLTDDVNYYVHMPSFELNHRYRWAVGAQRFDGAQGEYSEWSYFEFTDEGIPPPVTNTVTLTWAVPESRVDGSLLEPDDISQYIVVYQKEQEAIKEITIEDVRLTELTLENLSDGYYQFKIRVVDKMGLASDFSAGARIILPRSVRE